MARVRVAYNKQATTYNDQIRLLRSRGLVISDEDKARWNAKQDALIAGSGISIENGVISSDIDTSLSVSDMESTSGKMVSGVSVNDRVIHVQRANVKIPVGSETASPSATIWIE